MSHKITFAILGWPSPSHRRRNRVVTVIGAACALLFNGSTQMTKQISPLRERLRTASQKPQQFATPHIFAT
jgi:hypothetical protein